MNKFDLQHRTRKFHVSLINICEHFPKNAAGFETAKQVIRAAGSVGANYRLACRAKSMADFIYKMNVVLEEADESLYWPEATKDAGLVQSTNLESLIKEGNELVSIFNAASITAKRNNKSLNPKI